MDAFAEKAVIYLKNGDRVSGEIISESTNEVTLSTAVFGTVNVPTAEISKRERITELQSPSTTNAPVVAATSSTNAPPAQAAVKKTDPVKPANL